MVNKNRALLLYMQDLGGTNFLLSLLQSIEHNLPSDIRFFLLAHPMSREIISKELLGNKILRYEEFPISAAEWQIIIKDNNIRYVISTLSSNKYDLSNANLIKAAKKSNIPTLGFLDHWKGFDRLFDDNYESTYCPDWLGVIDEYCVSELRDKKITSRIQAVGHPVLESLMGKKSFTSKSNRILFVSQPEVAKGTFDSLFLTMYKQTNLINSLVDNIKKYNSEFNLYYRAHPKENLNNLDNLPLILDRSRKSELFNNYDIFIGFNSMLLIEAQIFGAKTISIRFPEVIGIYSDEIPYSFAMNVNNLSEFKEAINGNISYSEVPLNPFKNSSERCLKLIQSFLKSTSYA